MCFCVPTKTAVANQSQGAKSSSRQTTPTGIAGFSIIGCIVLLWTTITLLSFAFNVSTYTRAVATVYLLSLRTYRHDPYTLTSTAYQVFATRAGIDSALAW